MMPIQESVSEKTVTESPSFWWSKAKFAYLVNAHHMKKIAQDSHQLNSSYLIILIRSRNIVYLKGIGFYTACQAIPVNAMVESICAKCLPKESLRCPVFTFRKIETLIFIPLTGKKFIIPFSSLQVEYFPTVQSIQYFAPNYLGFHISNFEKILFARAKYSILCTYIPGGPYIQLHKNTSWTCKVFNTLHLNTWRSIYPTSNKYFLHVQSIQYFAPKYLGVHTSNFKKNTSC